jgi:uncharacterized protein YbjT (DUF2867 family)
MRSRILVTSAAGKVGWTVVRQLQEMGKRVRAAVRDPEKAADLGGSDTEIVSFDFDRPELVEKAVDGISALCLITPPHFKQVEWATETIDRALEAGVGRIVRLSVRVADLTPSTKMTRWHRTAERFLKASECEWTIVRPTPFMQNFMGLAPRSREGYFFPVSEDVRTCHMDIRDAALVPVSPCPSMTCATFCPARPGEIFPATTYPTEKPAGSCSQVGCRSGWLSLY